MLVGSSAWLLVTSWGIFALSYATAPPTPPSWMLGASLGIGVTFTCVAAWLIVLAWTEAEKVPAVTVILFTALVILFLALLPRLGG
jgi:hypothetical protein